MTAMRKESAQNGKQSEKYNMLRKTLTELEDVCELDELSNKSKETLFNLGFLC